MTTEELSSSEESSSSSSSSSSDLLASSSIYCYCHQAATCCTKCGIPLSNRDDTQKVMELLCHSERPMKANVFGNGPLVMSDIPQSARSQNSKGGVILGIDEAGRGSVLGPMVYGMAYWSVDCIDQIPKGFHDSKQLTDDTRTKLLDQMLHHPDIGFGMRSILPSEISRHMLRPKPYNLNEMSHDAAMVLIRKLVDSKSVTIQTCYIDTVGNPAYYKRKLEREFPGIEFVVESKADANYAPCSAASVVAKVMRDRMAEGWKFSEPNLDWKNNYGSGYPSDPKCKQWMKDNLHCQIFGFSDVMRFSWAPTKTKLLEEAVKVTFAADLDDQEDNMELQKSMSAFLGGTNQKRKRLGYFEKRKLQVVTKM